MGESWVFLHTRQEKSKCLWLALGLVYTGCIHVYAYLRLFAPAWECIMFVLPHAGTSIDVGWDASAAQTQHLSQFDIHVGDHAFSQILPV